MHLMRNYSAQPQRIRTYFQLFLATLKMSYSKKENNNKGYNRETDSLFSWKMLDGLFIKTYLKLVTF